MKKLFFLTLFSMFFALSLFAGPFGLKNGMSFEEVTQACGGISPRRIADDDRYFISPVKKHSAFETYIAWINSDYGLYYIKANGPDIKVNNHGDEIKDRFYSLLVSLSKNYGEAYVENRLKIEDPLGVHGDDDWRYDFVHGNRDLYAEWTDFSECKDEIKNEVSGVFLGVKCMDGYNEFYVSVEYELKNNDLVEASEDDPLIYPIRYKK